MVHCFLLHISYICNLTSNMLVWYNCSWMSTEEQARKNQPIIKYCSILLVKKNSFDLNNIKMLEKIQCENNQKDSHIKSLVVMRQSDNYHRSNWTSCPSHGNFLNKTYALHSPVQLQLGWKGPGNKNPFRFQTVIFLRVLHPGSFCTRGSLSCKYTDGWKHFMINGDTAC